MAKLRYTGIGLGCMILLLFSGVKFVSWYETVPTLLQFRCSSDYKTNCFFSSKTAVRRNLVSFGPNMDSPYRYDFSHFDTLKIKTHSPASVSSLKSWLRSNPIRFAPGRDDITASYIRESEYLASQFDFFLKVVCNPKIRFLRLKNFSKPFHIGKPASENKGGSFFAETTFIATAADSEKRNYKPLPVKNVKTYSIFLKHFSVFDSIPSQPDRALINFKFHRYLTLLLNFPPNLIEGTFLC